MSLNALQNEIYSIHVNPFQNYFFVKGLKTDSILSILHGGLFYDFIGEITFFTVF